MFRRRWQRPNRVRAMVAGGLAALAASAVPAVGADPLVGREAWLPRVVPAGLPAPENPIPPIAIIETWMDPRHPEMQGGWVALRRPGPVPEDGDFIGGVEWLERINHGTMVASVIGAPENGVGIQGMFPATPVWLYGTSGRCTDVAAATRQFSSAGASGRASVTKGSSSSISSLRPRRATSRHSSDRTAQSSIGWPPATLSTSPLTPLTIVNSTPNPCRSNSCNSAPSTSGLLPAAASLLNCNNLSEPNIVPANPSRRCISGRNKNSSQRPLEV